MFGRQPRLPIDLAFGLPVDGQSDSHSKYVQGLKSRLEESYRVATKNAAKVAERNKKSMTNMLLFPLLKSVIVYL